MQAEATLKTIHARENANWQKKKRAERDNEKGYPKGQFVAKLRRLADCIDLPSASGAYISTIADTDFCHKMPKYRSRRLR